MTFPGHLLCALCRASVLTRVCISRKGLTKFPGASDLKSNYGKEVIGSVKELT